MEGAYAMSAEVLDLFATMSLLSNCSIWHSSKMQKWAIPLNDWNHTLKGLLFNLTKENASALLTTVYTKSGAPSGYAPNAHFIIRFDCISQISYLPTPRVSKPGFATQGVKPRSDIRLAVFRAKSFCFGST